MLTLLRAYKMFNFIKKDDYGTSKMLLDFSQRPVDILGEAG